MQGVRTAVHQFFKGELRLPPMRTETAVTGERQALNVRSFGLSADVVPLHVYNPYSVTLLNPALASQASNHGTCSQMICMILARHTPKMQPDSKCTEAPATMSTPCPSPYPDDLEPENDPGRRRVRGSSWCRWCAASGRRMTGADQVAGGATLAEVLGPAAQTDSTAGALSGHTSMPHTAAITATNILGAAVRNTLSYICFEHLL